MPQSGPGLTVVVDPLVDRARPAAPPRRQRRRRPSPRVRKPGRAGPPSAAQDSKALAAVVVLAALLGAIHNVTTAAPAATTAPATTAPALSAAAPFTGPAGCTVKDPTTRGCLTPTTARALAEIDRVFGGYRKGPVVGSAGCWDAHAWNPTSDHPLGKACDLFPTGATAGQFASGPGLDHGWELAKWLRANAAALHIHYIIWQGRIWDSVERTGDADGWGHPYDGGGIYNARSATGGHFDHVHVSFKV